jgi:antitoxin component of MazEF toxin-antitoxin module
MGRNYGELKARVGVSGKSSLCVIIPKAFANQLHLRKKDDVIVCLTENNELLLKFMLSVNDIKSRAYNEDRRNDFEIT